MLLRMVGALGNPTRLRVPSTPWGPRPAEFDCSRAGDYAVPVERDRAVALVTRARLGLGQDYGKPGGQGDGTRDPCVGPGALSIATGAEKSMTAEQSDLLYMVGLALLFALTNFVALMKIVPCFNSNLL